ncbi:MAG: hypothetical protein D6B25_14870 [Desulfobulbaceae bacterium]|nr:MAG: hypothetical protein D6B25_14870 [Desulfobulbaceae bacterium]
MNNQTKRNPQTTMISDADFDKLAKKLSAPFRIGASDIGYSRVADEGMSLHQQSYIITKAYNETVQKNDWIENILLDRDYIID